MSEVVILTKQAIILSPAVRGTTDVGHGLDIQILRRPEWITKTTYCEATAKPTSTLTTKTEIIAVGHALITGRIQTCPVTHPGVEAIFLPRNIFRGSDLN